VLDSVVGYATDFANWAVGNVSLSFAILCASVESL